MYFKILNEEENHHGLQYKTGVNKDILPWDPNTNCVPGGIYFLDGEHICRFLGYGPYIREVKLLKDSLISHGADKSKANKVWLGKRRDLSKVSTWEWMVENGANIHVGDNYALRLASAYGHLKVVKFLVENGADIHAYNDCALRWASEKGHLKVVKFLVKNGADIHSYDNYALIWASASGYLEVVKFLVENGADIHANDDYALRYASTRGHLEIVKFLKSCG